MGFFQSSHESQSEGGDAEKLLLHPRQENTRAMAAIGHGSSMVPAAASASVNCVRDASQLLSPPPPECGVGDALPDGVAGCVFVP